MGPGGLPGLQNRVGGRKVAGGFDSLPPPPDFSAGASANGEGFGGQGLLRQLVRRSLAEGGRLRKSAAKDDDIELRPQDTSGHRTPARFAAESAGPAERRQAAMARVRWAKLGKLSSYLSPPEVGSAGCAGFVNACRTKAAYCGPSLTAPT